jgi:PIN domain nuclease of toxin-antitoxin system
MTPEDFHEVPDESYFLCKPVEHLLAITNFYLPHLHKDPFDRFLVWEAIKNDYILLKGVTQCTITKLWRRIRSTTCRRPVEWAVR